MTQVLLAQRAPLDQLVHQERMAKMENQVHPVREVTVVLKVFVVSQAPLVHKD